MGPKPDKPYPEFPLFAHGSGQWAKKIRGKLWYFGVWDDPDAALVRYLEERDFIHAGQNPRLSGNLPGVVEGVEIGYCVNYWLGSKKRQMQSGELAQRTYDDYLATGKRVIEFFGRNTFVGSLQAVDFVKFRQTWPKWGPTSVRREIVQTRGIFKLCREDGILPHEPNYGTGFKPPSKKVIRTARQLKVQEHGTQMLLVDEIRSILSTAKSPWDAIVLLGINCGFGNSDISRLPRSAIDGEWIDFPRGKTSVERRAWLWPETREALQKTAERRPAACESRLNGRVFLTKFGNEFVRFSEAGKKVDSVSTHFQHICKKAGVDRLGVGYYSLRRSFETIAAQTGQQVAVNCVMGHEEAGMSAVYRQFVSDENIRMVCEHVRNWVFPILLFLLFLFDPTGRRVRTLFSIGL